MYYVTYINGCNYRQSLKIPKRDQERIKGGTEEGGGGPKDMKVEKSLGWGGYEGESEE